MIDIFLMKRLLNSILDGARLIIVGDEDQLPSVGPGYVLGDLIASGTLPVVRLNEIHRQAKDSHIVKLASAINNQNLSSDDLISHNDVTFYSGTQDDIDGARLIIVGDEDQLPSVGPGYVLGDLIASGTLPVVRLNEIHRQAKDSHIVKLASAINNQNLSSDDLISHNDVTFYSGTQDDIHRVILNQIGGAIHKGYDLIEDIQVLIPQYKGTLVIDMMNASIQSKFNPNYQKEPMMRFADKTYYLGDKVIQLQNDKEKGVMNGDIGVIKKIRKNDKAHKVLEVSFDGHLVLYEQSDLDQLNLAYVISIHKSQGSEYKIVFLPIIKSYMHMLKKELIYTAITRAKSHLLILGDLRLLQYASNQLVEKRHTMLKNRLQHDPKSHDLFDVLNDEEDDDTLDEDTLDNLSPWDLMN